MFLSILGVCIGLFLAICANRYINDWHAVRLRNLQSRSLEIEGRLKTVILERKRLEHEIKTKENVLYNLETQLDNLLEAERKAHE